MSEDISWRLGALPFLLWLLIFIVRETSGTTSAGKFVVLSIADKETPAVRRLRYSAEFHRLPLKIVGLGEKWPGNGQKIVKFREELELYKNEPETIVLLVDAFDVLFNAGAEQIVEKFKIVGAKVLFSALKYCWPEFLLSKYPSFGGDQKYLNSGLLIGYAPELYGMVTSSPFPPSGRDQIFYTRIYVDDELRRKFNIKLDHRSELFHNLDSGVEDVEIFFDGKKPYIYNKIYSTTPLVIHASGPRKFIHKSFGNYIPDGWNPMDGCRSCLENTRNLAAIELIQYPTVVIGVFIEQATPFLEEFLNKVYALDYPKSKIHLFVHNAIEFHSALVDDFIENRLREYHEIKLIGAEDITEEWHVRNLGIEECMQVNCDFYFSVDSVAHIDNPKTLRLLIEQNRTVIAPLMVRYKQSWSNFWGCMTEQGWYRRSMDYVEIIENRRRGLWNVPHIKNCYLIRGDVIHDAQTRPTYKYPYEPKVLADSPFCYSLRENDVDMFVSNRHDFGHLVKPDDFESHYFNDLYEIDSNRLDWEARYVHHKPVVHIPNTESSMSLTKGVIYLPIFLIIFLTYRQFKSSLVYHLRIMRITLFRKAR